MDADDGGARPPGPPGAPPLPSAPADAGPSDAAPTELMRADLASGAAAPSEAAPSFSAEDRERMEHALDLARAAGAAGEVPVGAVLVLADGTLVAAHNHPLGLHDPTAHAEVLALREGGRRAAAPRLPGATLYVTLEPCLMCLGAMVHARIARLVYGAPDPLVGAVALFGTVPVGRPGLNHRLEIAGGLCASESAELLRAFFRARRGGAGADAV